MLRNFDMLNRLDGESGNGRVRAAQMFDSRRTLEALWERGRVESEEGQSAFADKWARLSSSYIDDSWGLFYQAMKVIRDRKVYERPHLMEDKKARSSFEEYWEEVVDVVNVDQELDSLYAKINVYMKEITNRRIGGYDGSPEKRQAFEEAAKAVMREAKARAVVDLRVKLREIRGIEQLSRLRDVLAAMCQDVRG
jgi:hypothetical protein